MIRFDNIPFIFMTENIRYVFSHDIHKPQDWHGIIQLLNVSHTFIQPVSYA